MSDSDLDANKPVANEDPGAPARPLRLVPGVILLLAIFACVGFYLLLVSTEAGDEPVPLTRAAADHRPRTGPGAAVRQAAALPVVAGTGDALNIGERNFDCVVEPFQVVKLAPSVVGTVGQLYVERGQSVRKGQVLGTLDDRVETANLALARDKARDQFTTGAIRERLTYLQLVQQRAEELAAKKFMIPAKRDEAISDAKVAEQQLHEAELNEHMAKLEVTREEQMLRQRRLVSPFDGLVTEVLLRPGEYRDDKSAVLSLAQINPLRVEAFIPTRYYGQISHATRAIVMPEQPVGGSHPGKVTIVDKVVDAASGTFGVRLEMPNPGHVVPAGLQCKIHFG